MYARDKPFVVFLENNDDVDEVQGGYAFLCSVFVSFPLFLDTSKGDWFDARAGPFLSFCPGVKDPLLARRERPCFIRLPRGQGVGRVYEDEAVGRLSAVSLPSLPPPPVLQPVFPLSPHTKSVGTIRSFASVH